MNDSKEQVPQWFWPVLVSWSNGTPLDFGKLHVPAEVQEAIAEMVPGSAQDGRGQDPTPGGTGTPGEAGDDSTDRPALTRKVPAARRRYREPRELSQAIVRLVRSLGRHVAGGDPEDLPELDAVVAAAKHAMAMAVTGIRQGGRSDAEIGRVLGITRQAVQERWPR